jgi:putative hydrolase of the HAD superfamily
VTVPSYAPVRLWPRPLAVTFDVTGTLFHCPRVAEIYAEVLERHGLPVEAAEVSRLIPEVWRELDCRVRFGEDRFGTHPGGARGWWARFLERLCERLDQPRPARFAAAELFDRFAHAEAWEVYPEIRETLSRLRAMGIRCGVVSNWDDRLPLVLERLALAPCFEAVVYSAAVGVEKPHPAIFRRAVEALEAPAAATLHVGDRLRDDVEGARAAGLQALHLGRRGAPGDLPDLAELPDLIGRA